MKKLNISYEKRKGLYGYGFIAIWFIGAIFFFIVPIVKSFIYSFNIVTPEDSRLSQVWAGIENYKSIFLVDPKYRQYLVQVLRDTAIQTPIILVFSLFVAIVINQEFRGKNLRKSGILPPRYNRNGSCLCDNHRRYRDFGKRLCRSVHDNVLDRYGG